MFPALSVRSGTGSRKFDDAGASGSGPEFPSQGDTFKTALRIIRAAARHEFFSGLGTKHARPSARSRNPTVPYRPSVRNEESRPAAEEVKAAHSHRAAPSAAPPAERRTGTAESQLPTQTDRAEAPPCAPASLHHKKGSRRRTATHIRTARVAVPAAPPAESPPAQVRYFPENGGGDGKTNPAPSCSEGAGFTLRPKPSRREHRSGDQASPLAFL